MKKFTHEFDYLRYWDSLVDTEMKEQIDEKSIATMQRIVEFLCDETQSNRIKVTEDNFVSLVDQMLGLLKLGSRMLGETIIEASELADNWEYDKAIEVYEALIDRCKSKFYRDIAKSQIKSLKKHKQEGIKGARSYNHLVKVNEQEKRLYIYRVDIKTSKKHLLTYTDLPNKKYSDDPKVFEDFARMTGENILLDNPFMRKLLDL